MVSEVDWPVPPEELILDKMIVFFLVCDGESGRAGIGIMLVLVRLVMNESGLYWVV